MPLELTDEDRAMAAGEAGEATALAMHLVVRLAEARGARRLLDVTSAHVDSCLYHGEVSLDFAERLVAGEGRVRVPTTLNVSSLDLLHPGLYRGDADVARRARRLMECYVALGGEPTWTCAPYQSPHRPAFGEHIAWAESNAIVFANSVLGARTDRYGDFVDICAALTGRVPAAGLHLDEHRRAGAVFRLDLPDRLLGSEVLYPVLGHLVGRAAGTLVPVIVGLPPTASEDSLKALAAAAASSGGVAMFHAVGITPEAPTLDEALGGDPPLSEVTIDVERMRAARDELTTASRGPLAAVSVGTPHFSLDEFRSLVRILGRGTVAEGVDVFVNTSREVLAAASAEGLVAPLRRAGIDIVTDTCTYITPILRDTSGIVMTNSAKWAYYAPGNLGVDVAFGSLDDCVRSAVAGSIVWDESVWQ